MTPLLERAFERAAALGEDAQDAIAALVLRAIESEERWDELFRGSQDALAKLAEEALDEHWRDALRRRLEDES